MRRAMPKATPSALPKRQVFSRKMTYREPGHPGKVHDAVFLGHAGGTTLRNFAHLIGEVYAVRPARIELDHSRNDQRISAEDRVTVRGVEPVDSDESITCAISGHDRPGQEYRTELQRVADPPLIWEVRGRCGFATDFDYSSNDR